MNQVKQAIQDFETKYEKRIRNLKVFHLHNVDIYLENLEKFWLIQALNYLTRLELKVQLNWKKMLKNNKSYSATA